MENDELLLSIVIPTFERYEYLRECLKAAVSIVSEEIEFVVQDNTKDNEEIVPFIERMGDKRIKYYHEERRMTVSENSDQAIEHSRGKYICMIGDDDTVCSNIVDLAKCMKQYSIDTCCFGICKYIWPDLLEQVPLLFCYEIEKTDMYFTYKNPKDLLHACLSSGVHDITNLPRVYHAISSRRILEQIKDRTGTYFPGPSPDMANAVATMLLSSKHVQTEIPIMISGYSGKSTGGLGKRGLHKGALKGRASLPKNILEIWDNRIPRLWMGDTIWPASAITSLKAMGYESMRDEIDFSIIYASVLAHAGELGAVLECGVTPFDVLGMIKYAIKKCFDKYLRRKKETKNIIVKIKRPFSLCIAKDIQDTINNNYSIEKAFQFLHSGVRGNDMP